VHEEKYAKKDNLVAVCLDADKLFIRAEILNCDWLLEVYKLVW